MKFENAYSRPQNYGFGGLTPKWGDMSTEPPKDTSLHGKTPYDRRQNRSTRATYARDEETKKDKERNLSVANWIFAQTTHVVRSKYRLAWWVVFRQ